MVSVLEFTFINMATVAFLTGVMISRYEKYLPAFIIKGYRYGSFAYQGPNASFLQFIEIPKSYYRHFYYFASTLNLFSWVSMFAAYYLNYSVLGILKKSLKVLVQTDSPTPICGLAAFIALTLLTIQSFKRLYETRCMQIFAKSSKMNFSHYAVGIIHYFGCTVAILGEAPLFSGDFLLEKSWLDYRTKICSTPCILIFLWACYEQYQSNCILVNLRKDKKGNLVTEDHGVPNGRFFSVVSSPHRMCELTMYTMLVILVPTRLFMCIYAWVFANQVQTALQAHEWYLKTFKTYPKNRTAIIPHVL